MTAWPPACSGPLGGSEKAAGQWPGEGPFPGASAWGPHQVCPTPRLPRGSLGPSPLGPAPPPPGPGPTPTGPGPPFHGLPCGTEREAGHTALASGTASCQACHAHGPGTPCRPASAHGCLSSTDGGGECPWGASCGHVVSWPEHRTCSRERLPVQVVSPEVCEGTEEAAWARPFPPGVPRLLCAPAAPPNTSPCGSMSLSARPGSPAPPGGLSASLSPGLPREPSAGPSRGRSVQTAYRSRAGGFCRGSCRGPGRRGSGTKGFRSLPMCRPSPSPSLRTQGARHPSPLARSRGQSALGPFWASSALRVTGVSPSG